MGAEGTRTLGTLLRHLIDLLDGAVEEAYARSGLEYRPRYTPVMRALIDLGPASIRAISQHAGITHSAASQTVAQMARQGLLGLQAGADAREQIVSLASEAEAMVPLLQRQWAATNAAAQALDDELSMPLSALLSEAIEALEQRSFSERIDLASARMKQTKRRR